MMKSGLNIFCRVFLLLLSIPSYTKAVSQEAVVPWVPLRGNAVLFLVIAALRIGGYFYGITNFSF
jgi:hypothetical protein